jgi:hypothetical protein
VLTPNGLERPKVKERVIALVLGGKTDREIAQAISTTRRSVSFQAISKFRQRHQDEIVSAIQRAEDAVIDLAIRDKEERIRRSTG